MGKVEHPLLRKLANQATDARPRMVANICQDALEAGPDFRSIMLAGRLTVALATDGVDGFLARQSNIPSPEYAKKDRDYDKWVIYMLYMALGIITGDDRYGVYLTVNLIRDSRTDATRDMLASHGYETDARDLGKHKFGLQSLGLVADFSPVGDMAPDLVHGVHMTASGLSVVSGIDIEFDARRKLGQIFGQMSDTSDATVAPLYTTPERF